MGKKVYQSQHQQQKLSTHATDSRRSRQTQCKCAHLMMAEGSACWRAKKVKSSKESRVKQVSDPKFYFPTNNGNWIMLWEATGAIFHRAWVRHTGRGVQKVAVRVPLWGGWLVTGEVSSDRQARSTGPGGTWCAHMSFLNRESGLEKCFGLTGKYLLSIVEQLTFAKTKQLYTELKHDKIKCYCT